MDDHFDLTTTRETPITFSGVNSYIIKDFAARIKLIAKELENLDSETNLTRRKEITTKINQLYKNATI